MHRIKSFAGKDGPLERMQLIRNGRLSVCRVTKDEWEFIMGLAEGKEGEAEDDAEKAETAGSAVQQPNKAEKTE